MAGLAARTVQLLGNPSNFYERPRVARLRNFSDSSFESENISCSSSLQSRESSIDLNPDEKIASLLEKKHAKVKLLNEKLRKYDQFSCFFGILGLSFSLISCEFLSSALFSIELLLVLTSISTVLLIFFLWLSWVTYFDINREKKIGTREMHKKTFCRSSCLKYLVAEVLAYMVQPVPFNHTIIEAYQLNGLLKISLNEILTSIMLVRVFLLLKLLRHYSKWTNEHSSAICDLYAAKATERYALKALLKDQPIFLMVSLFLLSITVFSLALRLYERNFESHSGELDYFYLWNSMWLISLTMTTVGYGDFFPKTHPGRFICALSAYWGVFIVSLIILTFTNLSGFNPAEQRSFEFLKRLRHRKKSLVFAYVYVSRMLDVILMSLKQKKKNYFEKIMKSKNQFSLFKRYQKRYLEVENSPQEMLRIINEQLRIVIDKFCFMIREAKDFDLQLENIVEFQEKSIELLRDSQIYTLEALRYIQ